MGLAIFYETLLVILVSALTAAVCLSSYLVTKRKTMLFACIAFMFYFFDVASILQDDYAARELASGLTQEYYFIRSLYTMVTGAGFLGAFWFMVCEYIGECRRSIRITPIVVYAILSLSIAASSGGDSAMRQCANPLAIGARLRRQSGWESFCSQPFFELSVARLPRSSR